MSATVIAIADELASAAELVMGKVDACPAAVVRGYPYVPATGSGPATLTYPGPRPARPGA